MKSKEKSKEKSKLNLSKEKITLLNRTNLNKIKGGTDKFTYGVCALTV